jgi:selenocysteine lyase/cysteine desulfurase
VPLDVRGAGVDFLANGGHKWLMGPMGCGFMYIRPELHKRLDPVFAGWLSVKNSWDFLDYRLDFLEDAERYEPGTPNFLGIAGARAATDLLVEIGPERIEAHLHSMGDFLIDAMEERGFTYTGSRDKKNRAGIYSFRHDRAEEIFRGLTEKQIYVSLREGVIRISPHFYNTQTELQELVRTIEKNI